MAYQLGEESERDRRHQLEDTSRGFRPEKVQKLLGMVVPEISACSRKQQHFLVVESHRL